MGAQSGSYLLLIVSVRRLASVLISSDLIHAKQNTTATSELVIKNAKYAIKLSVCYSFDISLNVRSLCDKCFCFYLMPGMTERERQVMKKLKEVVDKQRDEIRAKDRELTLKNEDIEAVKSHVLPELILMLAAVNAQTYLNEAR